MWTQSLGGSSSRANNGDFVINALDNLSAAMT
jgi:hypothetical protein